MPRTEPDGAALAELGARLRKADGPWRGRLLRMRHANDFQTKELGPQVPPTPHPGSLYAYAYVHKDEPFTHQPILPMRLP